MAVDHLFAAFILFLISNTGFSVEISLFVQTGASVQLDIQQLPEFDLLSWMNDKSESIVRYNSDSKRVTPHGSYKDRVDFNDTTFSLTLKNMQKTDSGLYTARISGLINKDCVTYREMCVSDAVEAPVLTVNSNWFSSDSCTVNFTCRAHELMITSSYQNKVIFSEADDTDYDDVENMTQKMTGDTWTTVTYCTVGRHQTPS
ncbi:CD48 antigen-like [Sinocyclocheilus rhinocerous]|uniref:CD48 antigen-like n=1 Tax=Sinocyclocheilus rhinocerous TaxID=307959 RepID=UPI0007B98E3D|nr:PREDICTED: CD48 antigen-like [Sinocyclocheilus rhinocerous]